MPLHEIMKQWTDDEFDSFQRATSGFDVHGYWITTVPGPDGFDAWISFLSNAQSEFMETIEGVRTKMGFRGRSKNLLKYLHRAHPNPAFGVEVAPRAL